MTRNVFLNQSASQQEGGMDALMREQQAAQRGRKRRGEEDLRAQSLKKVFHFSHGQVRPSHGRTQA